MEGVSHRFVHTNGIRMHIAEKGSGPTVLLLHGFPECWYSWRHQINALADAGYHVVAPDMRGYGESDAPKEISKYSSLHIVGDLIGLLDHLQQEKVLVVGHDWGAFIAWDLCLFRPDRVRAVVALSVHYFVRNPLASPLSLLKQALGENFYICRFQEPGKAEADFASRDLKSVFSIMFLNTHKIVMSAIGAVPEPELTSWFTENDVKFYSDLYRKTGFTGPLNYYRAIDLTWELKAPWTGKTIDVPAMFITGDRDVVYSFPGAKEFIHGGDFSKAVVNLQDAIVLEDAGHFMHQEKASQVNDLLVKFLKKVLIEHNVL